MRGSVTNNDLYIWGQRTVFGGNVAVVVRVSGRTQVRGVSVHTVALMAHDPGVVGRGEVAGFDNRGHVNRRRRVAS